MVESTITIVDDWLDVDGKHGDIRHYLRLIQ